MKKTLAIFLSVLFLLPLAACARGGDPARETDPANPVEDPWKDEGESAAPIVSPDLGLNEGKHYIYHEFVFEAQDDLPLFVCDGADTAEVTGDIRLRIADERNNDLFTVVLRVPMDAPPEENQSVFMLSLYFTHDNRYLIGVIPQQNDREAFYYYDNAKKTLDFIGRAEEIRFLGKTFLLRALYEGEAERSEVAVFDKDCRLLGTYPDVYDMELYERMLCCLQGSDPVVLAAAPLDHFFADEPNPETKELCRFPGYSARFGLADFGRVTLMKTDGNELRLLSLSEALLYACELAETPAEGNEPITESCDLFSVTLPGMFKDRYVCEKTETEMLFYEKAAKEAGEGGFLFGFACLSPEEALNVAENNNRLVYRRYLRGGEERYIVTQLPTGEPGNQYLDEFVPLRDAYGSAAGSLAAADGAKLLDFDYSGLVSRKYSGKTEGGVYELEITSAESYELTAALRFTPAEGDPQETNLLILLLQTGKFTFPQQNGALGFGELTPQGSGWLMTLNGAADTWLHTAQPVALK